MKRELTPAKMWQLRERVHKIADEIAQVDRALADPLYVYCDTLDARARLIPTRTHEELGTTPQERA